MAYPSRPLRKTSFSQQEAQGNELNTAVLDAELNHLVACLDQVESRLESITTPAGLLKNVAAATAMALNGVQVFTATASQTIFTTTIPWDTSFSNLTVTVVSQGLKLNPSLVTVANSSGVLRVTIPAQTAGNIVQVLAYSAGAGVLTRLASLSAGDGATLVAVRDLGGYWTSAEVEGALQEVGARIVTLEAGDPTRWRKDGANGPATGNWNLGGYQIKGLAPGTLSTDAVNLAQLSVITNEVSSLLRGACTVFGFTMQGGIDMAGNAIENLPAPIQGGDAANKKYVDDTVAGGTALLAGYLKRDGTNSPSANISWNNKKITVLADGTDATDAVNLGQLAATAATCLAVDGSNSPTADISWDNNKITDLADGVDPQDAATVSQIPDVSGFLKRDGSNSPTDDIDWDGNKITGLADGTEPDDAATVGQVQTVGGRLIARGNTYNGSSSDKQACTEVTVNYLGNDFLGLKVNHSGLAFISVSMYVNQISIGHARCHILKNGVSEASFSVDETGDIDIVVGGSLVVSLNADDTIAVAYERESANINNTRLSFIQFSF